jgi:hypothetical protein
MGEKPGAVIVIYSLFFETCVDGLIPDVCHTKTFGKFFLWMTNSFSSLSFFRALAGLLAEWERVLAWVWVAFCAVSFCK